MYKVTLTEKYVFKVTQYLLAESAFSYSSKFQ